MLKAMSVVTRCLFFTIVLQYYYKKYNNWRCLNGQIRFNKKIK